MDLLRPPSPSRATGAGARVLGAWLKCLTTSERAAAVRAMSSETASAVLAGLSQTAALDVAGASAVVAVMRLSVACLGRAMTVHESERAAGLAVGRRRAGERGGGARRAGAAAAGGARGGRGSGARRGAGVRRVAGAGGMRRVEAEVVDALARARALVAEAEAERARIVGAAQAEAEAERARAHAAGVEQARVETAAMMAAARARWSAALAAEEPAVVALACEVAAAVLGRESALGTEVLRDVTRQALARVRKARRVVLRVHPSEAERARTEGNGWLPAGMAPEVFNVEADAAVGVGGVVVETELGRLDARLDTQLAAIARALSEAGR